MVVTDPVQQSVLRTAYGTVPMEASSSTPSLGGPRARVYGGGFPQACVTANTDSANGVVYDTSFKCTLNAPSTQPLTLLGTGVPQHAYAMFKLQGQHNTEFHNFSMTWIAGGT
jgi:hypothetical protein